MEQERTAHRWIELGLTIACGAYDDQSDEWVWSNRQLLNSLLSELNIG